MIRFIDMAVISWAAAWKFTVSSPMLDSPPEPV